MANITCPNIRYAAQGYRQPLIWKLTRAMKAAGWRYKCSSDSSAKDTTGNPNNDKWGGGVQVTGRTATGAFDIGTPTSIKEMGLVTISGGTIAGFASTGGLSLSGSVGRFLKITGATNSANNGTWQIFRVNSATSVDVVNPAAVAETTPGTAVWSELDALLDGHPGAFANDSGPGAWWCAQGPSTMKIPIGNTTPTGFFLVGEEITQATTGATGEILGVMLDTVTSTGFLVVNPRASGTGAGLRGWDATSTITGAASGATIAPTATVIEFITEVVFWKNTGRNGHLYIQCIDLTNEGTTLTSTSGRFSLMAATLGSATIPPGGTAGGNPTTNGFPTLGTMCVVGTAGSGAASTGSNYWCGSQWDDSQTYMGWGGHVLVANCLSGPGLSADGTFSVLEYVNPGIYASNWQFNYVALGFTYSRVVNTEDGDVWPFVFHVTPTNTFPSTWTTLNRTNGSIINIGGNHWGFDTFDAQVLTYPSWYATRGWRRRGFSSGDVFQIFQGACLGFWNSTSWFHNGGYFSLTPSPDFVACTIATQSATEPIWLFSAQNNSRMRKGTFKWIRLGTLLGGSITLNGNTFVPIGANYLAQVYMGPWDGVTPYGLPV